MLRAEVNKSSKKTGDFSSLFVLKGQYSKEYETFTQKPDFAKLKEQVEELQNGLPIL